MATFPIQTVSQRTGLSSHVIRAWERRYQAIAPGRSQGKQRRYTEAEIDRLTMLQAAVRSGHRIGKVAKFPTEALRDLLHVQTTPPVLKEVQKLPGASLLPQILALVKNFEGVALDGVLRNALVGLGHQGLLRLVIAPIAEEVGERWRAGELTSAHEHFFTAGVKMFLGELTHQFAPSFNAPRMIVATPSGQLHELGAIMVASLASNLGWQTTYLGPSLPAHEIAGAAKQSRASAVALSIVYPEDDPNLDGELLELGKLLPTSTRLLAGGRAACGYSNALKMIGALYTENLDTLGSQLDALRRPDFASRERADASPYLPK